MFGPWQETEVAKEILSKKYYHEGEDFEKFTDRVSSVLSDEIKADAKKAMYDADFFPGGRSLYGAGAKGKFKASLSNCYILPSPEDTLESINEVAGKMARIFSMGGGCGLSLSNLRPKDAIVYNSARSSTGAVSFINIFNAYGDVIGAHARRAALLVGLDCSHPDIYEFLEIKQNDTAVQSANLSILFTDEFMEAVEADEEYELKFDVKATGEKIRKKIRARDLFWKFCEAQFSWGEPGAIFIDRVRSYNLLSGYPKNEYQIDICNPCAEFFGNSFNSCNLGSINLYNAVKNPFTKEAEIDWDKLANMVHLGIEILDQILDYGYDSQPLDENRACIDKWRAIGLGAFGLGDALVALNIKYGSPEAVELSKKLQKYILIHSLSASALIASEKGTFSAYDWNKVKKSPLIAALKNDKEWKNVYKMIETSGLRNGALISYAPNGSLATMAGMTGGAEPIFALSYERTTHANVGKGVFFRVLAKSAEHYMKMNNLPADTSDEELIKMNPAFICSHDVPPLDRVKMQAALQDSTDNAISSTVNLKEEATVDDIYNVYMEAWKSGCKGITTFRNNCSRTSILRTSHDEEFVQGGVQFNSISPISSDEIGDEVDGKKVTRKTACVPTMVNHIYSKEGNLVELYTDVTQGCSANINTITRLASLSLRSGIKVEEVLKQLRKETCSACIDRRKQGDKEVAKSCGNAIADAIEKVYVELQGEKKVADEKGLMTCPECGERTLRVEAKCVRCTSCHYSKCD